MLSATRKCDAAAQHHTHSKLACNTQHAVSCLCAQGPSSHVLKPAAACMLPVLSADNIARVQGPAVVLVMQGAGSASAATMAQLPHAESTPRIKRGDVFFVPCDTPLQLSAGPEQVCCSSAQTYMTAGASRYHAGA